MGFVAVVTKRGPRGKRIGAAWALSHCELFITQGVIHARRQRDQAAAFVRIGGASIAAIPLLALTGRSFAVTNAAMRDALKYQDKPNGEKDCAGCMQFVAGKTPTDKGGSKLMPGDTEISHKGYCRAWVAKPK